MEHRNCGRVADDNGILVVVDWKGDERRNGSLPDRHLVAADAVTFEDMLTAAEVAPYSDALIEEIARSGAMDGERLFGSEFVDDQHTHGSCFPPGTLIRMADGSQRPIEDVRLLDEVLTAEGNVRRVMRVMVRPHAGEVCRLKVWGHRHLRSTGEHPILTRRGYVAADQVKAGDWVVMPRYLPARVESIVPAEYIGATSKAAQKKTHAHAASVVRVNLPGAEGVTVERMPLPELIRLTPAFGRLVGLFLAEGSVTGGRVTFHFHEKEIDTLAADVVRIFADEFGVKANVCKNRGAARTCEVKVYGTGWAKLFEALGNCGSKHKRLHRHLTDGPREFLEAVLRGWQDGDGLGDPDRNGGVTISHTLAMNMYDVAAALGYKPTVETLQVAVNPRHKIRCRQLRYVVAWPKSDGEHPWKRCEQDDGRVYRLVDDVEREPYSGFVYNLEVEADHSYVAESIGVHNCNGFAEAGVLANARYRRGEPLELLSGAYAYSLMNGGRDMGSALADALANVQARGICRKVLCSWDMIYPRQQNKAACDEDAKRFRGFLQYPITTMRGVWTALCMGYDVGVAVHAGSNFMRVGASGNAGVDNGGGNHAVRCDGIRWTDAGPTGTGVNSWGKGYAREGRMGLHAGHFNQTFRSHQFWALPSTADDPNDQNKPPRLVVTPRAPRLVPAAG